MKNEQYYYKPIFGTNNAKIKKGLSEGVYTIILNFAPADICFNPGKYGFDLPNINPKDIAASHPNEIRKGTLCPFSTAECRGVCLFTAGNGSYPSVKIGRIKKGQAFLINPEAFVRQMKHETLVHHRKAMALGLQLAIRPNGTQDVPWEEYPVDGETFIEFVSTLENTIVYDYTKWTNRNAAYHLTYSYTGTPSSNRVAVKWLNEGGNIAFVYSGDMPETWNGFPVVSGDNTDIRYNDPNGHAIGLYAKGMAKGKAGLMKFVQVYA